MTASSEPAPFPLVEDDAPDGDPGGVGLCLSGGGYRAMLFHVGVLWRLHEMGWLTRLDLVSSVSGGSIAAGVLATQWGELTAGDASFEDVVADPVRRLAGRTIDDRAVLKGLLPGRSVGREVQAALAGELFGDTTLGALPRRPAFTFHATNVSTGKLVRLDRDRVSDWRIGWAGSAGIPLAAAVTASAAFPPVLSPYRLDTSGLRWRSTGGRMLPDASDFRDELVLTDGGVYDNLGLESLWAPSDTVLVSDGGGTLAPRPGGARDWARHFVRVTQVIDHQVRSLRIRQVQTAFGNGQKRGTHIGIRSRPSTYELPEGHLPVDDGAAAELAAIPTRLKRMPARQQERLVNWGYAIADVKMRTKVDPDAEPPRGFPYAGGLA